MATLPVITTVINEIQYLGGPTDEINVDFGAGPQTNTRTNMQADAQSFFDGVGMPNLMQSFILALWWSLSNGLANPDVIEGKALILNMNDPNGNVVKLVDSE